MDVGCAHGWFLEAAGADFATTGEPDLAVAQAARALGHQVRGGFFPDALGEERFDVIVFNDVLEHIPDINATLRSCYDRLRPGGLLVVNAPSRRGVLYWISRQLARVGLAGSFERLWQLGFPSPHVHYLDAASMRALAEQNGFILGEQMTLPSVSTSGLYDRIRYSREVQAWKAAALTAASPLFAVLPADIEVWFLRRQN